MTKNAKTVSITAVLAVVIIVLIILGRDMWIGKPGKIDCGDGVRTTIDLRNFSTQYFAYSIELEVNIKDKTKISAKLAPQQIQQLSEALQSANEFRKYVVAGYNSCAISKVQYSQFGIRFQSMDNVAREINQLTDMPSLSPAQSKSLSSLIARYVELAGKAASD